MSGRPSSSKPSGRAPKKARTDVRPAGKAPRAKKSEPKVVAPPPSAATVFLERRDRAKAKAALAESSGDSKGKAKERTKLASQSGAFEKTKPKKKTAAADRPLPKSFKVVVGSYEKLLYGLEGTVGYVQDALEFDLKPIFIFPAHVSCIKAVAASPEGGKWLATGSADEIVKVWDLRRRKEIGGLMHHEGSVTHLTFPSRSHLLSASEDGTLCLFRARDWSVLRALKGHKGHVNSVAVHPSGKVALSVGKDKTLRMWDLMRGKGVASTKLGKEGELVRWNTDGSMFAVQAQSGIDVYSTEMTLLHTIAHASRLHDIKFCKRVGSTKEDETELLFAAGEDKKLVIYDLSPDMDVPPVIIGEFVGHERRVKATDVITIALPVSEDPTAPKSTTVVCTASSDGKVHVYNLSDLPAPGENKEVVSINPVAAYDSKGTRLTCLTVAEGDVGATFAGKRKREDGSDDEGEDDDESEDEGELEAALEGTGPRPDGEDESEGESE